MMAHYKCTITFMRHSTYSNRIHFLIMIKIACKSVLAVLLLPFTLLSSSASTDDAIQRIEIRGVADPEWSSYRKIVKFINKVDAKVADRSMVDISYSLTPKDPNSSLEGINLTLKSETIHQNLPVTSNGLVAIPVIDAAYDEDAQLVTNRPKGTLSFAYRIHIKLNASGVYLPEQLKIACEQARKVVISIDHNWAQKKCTGIVFSNNSIQNPAITVQLEGEDSEKQTLPMIKNSVRFRFSEWMSISKISTPDKDIHLMPLLE